MYSSEKTGKFLSWDECKLGKEQKSIEPSERKKGNDHRLGNVMFCAKVRLTYKLTRPFSCLRRRVYVWSVKCVCVCSIYICTTCVYTSVNMHVEARGLSGATLFCGFFVVVLFFTFVCVCERSCAGAYKGTYVEIRGYGRESGLSFSHVLWGSYLGHQA